MDKPLLGKTALVTGASRGIGAATAVRLAELGANIGISYETAEAQAGKVAKAVETLGSQALILRCDANDPDTMPLLVDKLLNQFDQLHILVNNAGIYEGIGNPIGELPLNIFERTLNINVSAVFHLTQAVARVMASGGRIINVGSVLGERAIFPGASAYTMSKFAINGLTRSWAWELAPREITVNAVIPGPIRTGMGDPEAYQLTALKQLGEPREVASVIGFLAGPEASYVTGATLRVDGGVNA